MYMSAILDDELLLLMDDAGADAAARPLLMHGAVQEADAAMVELLAKEATEKEQAAKPSRRA